MTTPHPGRARRSARAVHAPNRIEFTTASTQTKACSKGVARGTTRPASPCKAEGNGARRGSAVLVVMILLACLALFLMANSRALHTLKQELKFIDQQQLKKYAPKK